MVQSHRTGESKAGRVFRLTHEGDGGCCGIGVMHILLLIENSEQLEFGYDTLSSIGYSSCLPISNDRYFLLKIYKILS